MLFWEEIRSAYQGDVAVKIEYRAKVIGGWLVKSGGAMAFVPDSKHEWKL